MPTMFEEEPKARCPDCSQSLTFIRTKSHQKRWYCYACEKYVDQPTEPTLLKDAHARIEALNGLQVIDSHGMIVGRVRKAISSDTGDVRSFVLSVDKEQFKTLLDERDMPREFELGHEKIATVGDVVILSDVFSPSAYAPPKLPKPPEESSNTPKCSRCSAPLIAGAKHCIKCGALLTSASCLSCGTLNPTEARYCKNCGNKLT
jgi:sporulation protein YlmC with PRC-barrel domain/ribosomal protein L40E